MSYQLFSATKNTWFLIRSFTQIFDKKSYFQYSLRKNIGLSEDNWVKINSPQTTQISPRSCDSQPYLLTLTKSSLLSSTNNNYSDYKTVGAFRKLASTPSSFFPAFSFNSAHTATQPILSWTHLAASACLQQRGQSLVPHTMPRFPAPSKSGRQAAFISLAGFYCSCTSESLWRVCMVQEWQVTNTTEVKCNFRSPNCPTNPQSEGKKLVIPTE